MKLTRIVLASVLALAIVAPEAVGAAPGPLTRGKAFAQKYCSNCHNILRTGASPNPKSPPFRALMQKYPIDSLEEALAEGIVVGHEATDMPSFEFEPEQISDLLAYIGRLKRR